MQKFVIRIFRSEMQRPSGVYAWQIPLPPEEPTPPLLASRFSPPLEAHEASYFAASERMARRSLRDFLIVVVLYMFLTAAASPPLVWGTLAAFLPLLKAAQQGRQSDGSWNRPGRGARNSSGTHCFRQCRRGNRHRHGHWHCLRP